LQQHLVDKTTSFTNNFDSQINHEEEQEKNKIIEYIRLLVEEGGGREHTYEGEYKVNFQKYLFD